MVIRNIIILIITEDKSKFKQEDLKGDLEILHNQQRVHPTFDGGCLKVELFVIYTTFKIKLD